MKSLNGDVRKKSDKLTCKECGQADIELGMLQPLPLTNNNGVQKLVYLCPNESCRKIIGRIFVNRRKDTTVPPTQVSQ